MFTFWTFKMSPRMLPLLVVSTSHGWPTFSARWPFQLSWKPFILYSLKHVGINSCSNSLLRSWSALDGTCQKPLTSLLFLFFVGFFSKYYLCNSSSEWQKLFLFLQAFGADMYEAGKKQTCRHKWKLWEPGDYNSFGIKSLNISIPLWSGWAWRRFCHRTPVMLMDRHSNISKHHPSSLSWITELGLSAPFPQASNLF